MATKINQEMRVGRIMQNQKQCIYLLLSSGKDRPPLASAT